MASAESEEAAITVFEKAPGTWGLADRFQFDGGSAFDAKGFRQGLAQLGVCCCSLYFTGFSQNKMQLVC